MRILTGILLITALLFSSCTKEAEDKILEEQALANTTEITETELPKAAFDALQELKTEMAAEVAPDRNETNERWDDCWDYAMIYADYNYHQNTCGTYTYYSYSHGHIYTGNTTTWSPTYPQPTLIYGPPQVGFSTETIPNELLYYWFGVYDYAKGEYAYTKASWGDISGSYTFDFTANNWHNTRIVVWKRDNSGQYGWRLIKGLWTMPFTN